jgi:repressor of nif and glnA expression
MRRDKKLAEEILRTLVLDDDWEMNVNALVRKLDDKASDSSIRYHVRLLEDISLIEITSGGTIRVTSAGQDRAENSDKPDATATWSALGG